MPARLKSMSEWSAPWIRPVAPPTCRFLPVSSSRCTRSISTRYVSPSTSTSRGPAMHSGSSYRGGLEALGDVRVEVVLPRETAPGGDPAAQRQPDADRRFDGGGVGDRQRAR